MEKNEFQSLIEKNQQNIKIYHTLYNENENEKKKIQDFLTFDNSYKIF